MKLVDGPVSINGTSRSEGNLLVSNSTGQLGYVCSPTPPPGQLQDINLAKVVCRQLGFAAALATTPSR